ncbi:MAG: hypothetical protein V3R83_10970 [Gammaproteobacteria bacterium]
MENMKTYGEGRLIANLDGSPVRDEQQEEFKRDRLPELNAALERSLTPYSSTPELRASLARFKRSVERFDSILQASADEREELLERLIRDYEGFILLCGTAEDRAWVKSARLARLARETKR